MATADSTHWIIVTDLDGTLLDHHNYSFNAAKLTLKRLEQHQVPVIINSSKTASEIEQLRVKLNNRHPFIAENGSGILIPKDYFTAVPESASHWKDYWEVVLGKSRQQLLSALNKLPAQMLDQVRGYHDMSLTDIMDATGLTKQEAKLSSERRYTEPLQWTGSEIEKKLFFGHLHKQRIHFTQGGRFIHLMGHSNKGSATAWLTKYYQQEYQKPVKVVALGDGNNDVDMLKAADIAVVIRSPVNPLPAFEHPCKIISEACGPEGWAETINHIFFTHMDTAKQQ